MSRGEKACVVVSIMYIVSMLVVARAVGPMFYSKAKDGYQQFNNIMDGIKNKIEDEFRIGLGRVNGSEAASFLMFLELYQKYQELKEKYNISSLPELKDNLDNETIQNILKELLGNNFDNETIENFLEEFLGGNVNTTTYYNYIKDFI